MRTKRKFTSEFKIELVSKYIRSHCSYNEISKEVGIDHSVLRKWVAIYNKQGVLGLNPKKSKKSYTIDFKLNVINHIEQKSLSLFEACLKFDIPSDSTIIKWQRDYNDIGVRGLENKPRGRPKSMNFKRKKKKSEKPLTKEEELLLENEGLRAENELLKKLQALTQAKKKRKR